MTRTTSHVLSMVCSFALSFSALAAAKAAPPPADPLPLDDLKRFTTVIEQIRNYYVYPTEDKQLFEGAIRGMLAGLDPHSAFFDPNEYNELQSSSSGKFGGLGIEIIMDDGLLRVVTAVDDTPAQKSGLKANDLIIRINETPVRGLSSKDAVDLMRGEPGTDVSLTVIRKDEEKPLIIKVTRAIIRTESVKGKLLANDVGYIRIAQFQSQTGKDLVTQLEKLRTSVPNKKLNG
ncbi:MAG: PDZ domain-containing protein, partial [Pseudomonadota bacterium]